jgi:hypothetical protein
MYVSTGWEIVPMYQSPNQLTPTTQAGIPSCNLVFTTTKMPAQAQIKQMNGTAQLA